MISAEQVFADYQPKVLSYVRSKIQNPCDVDDLVSAVFLKIVQNMAGFDPTKASVSTWVYTITRNTVIDYFRTHRSFVPLEEYMVDEEYCTLDDSDLEILADALLSLKEKERDLIVLHYYQGYTLKTIAEKMGMSYINAKVVHQKALNNLRTFYAAG